MTRWFLAAAVVLAGCASASRNEASGPGGTAFSYGVPTSATLAYAFADSSSFEIQAGAMGDIRATIASAGRAEVTYEEKQGAVEAAIRVTKFNGSMMNSAQGGGPTATEADVQGSAIVRVTPTGGVTVVSLPKLTPAVQQVGISSGFFRNFFSRLPAGRVAPGAVWVDTVTFTDDNGGTKATVTDIVTTTFAGDTMVGGASAAKLMTLASRKLEITGASQGVQIAQHLSGSTSGYVLWDTQRNVMLEKAERSALEGTFDLPQMDQFGLPVRAKSNGKLVLQ